MTSAAPDSLRTVCFGELDSGLWGVAVGAGVRLLALGGSDRGLGGFAPAQIDGSAEDQEWHLLAGGIDLAVTPQGEAVGLARPGSEAGPSDAGPGFDQLCRVTGRVATDGAEREVDCLGTRANRTMVTDLRNFDSIRGVCAWFGSDDGLALVALRPRGAEGHDADHISASVFEPERSLPVNDPRLSTTYTADGLLARLSLELWLGDGEDEYPRRAAGESAGRPAAGAQHGLDLQAGLLRCHSRGLEGPGAYLLVRSA